MGNSKIEWTEKTWNPATGCTKISPGCANCYAERMSKRLAGRCGYPADNPFAVTLHPERLDQPLHWRKPSRIFVCSMSDLFHEDVPDEWILRVFKTIRKCSPGVGDYPVHTFLMLTKRPERMRDVIMRMRFDGDKNPMMYLDKEGELTGYPIGRRIKNIWFGVTAENQEQADKRIPILLQIPAAVRFVSVEPMLGPVDLNHLQPNREVEVDCLKGTHGVIRPHPGTNTKIDWIICGGESGPGARPMRLGWARSLRDQCQAAGVPFFFKQWGEWCQPDQMQGSYDRPYKVFNFNKKECSNFLEKDPDLVIKCGKKKAGRLLDGRTWDEYPEVCNERG